MEISPAGLNDVVTQERFETDMYNCILSESNYNATGEVTRPDATSSLVFHRRYRRERVVAASVTGIEANYAVTATVTYYEPTEVTMAALDDGVSTSADLRAVGNAAPSGTSLPLSNHTIGYF